MIFIYNQYDFHGINRILTESLDLIQSTWFSWFVCKSYGTNLIFIDLVRFSLDTQDVLWNRYDYYGINNCLKSIH